MRYEKKLVAVLLLAAIAIIIPAACQSPSASLSGSRFEVTSLQIKPAQADSGSPVKVIASITNSGGVPGYYTAKLIVDGMNTEEKDIELDPGSSKEVTFTLSKTEPGIYKIGVGSKSSTLVVKPSLIAKSIELKNNDGPVTDFLSLSKPNTGYLVDFAAPSNPFIIHTVRIYGIIYGGRGFIIKDVEVRVLDDTNNVLFSTLIPGKNFPILSFLLSDIQTKGDWVDVQVPDVEVEGNFSVHVYTGSSEGQGFRMGTIDGANNTGSDITVRDAQGIDTRVSTWPYSNVRWYGDKSRVNWMVRVVGNAMVPEK